MIRLLKCEYMKTRRCYVFLAAIVITLAGLAWGLYGKYDDFSIENGWMKFLYQFPIMNAIFLPVLSTIVASRLCGIEHKEQMLRILCTKNKRGKVFDAKLLYGLFIVTICVLIMWLSKIIFGTFMGFGDTFPIRLYLLHLFFTMLVTTVIYILQHCLSMIFKNQAVAFFVGIIGEFIGLFSMFLPQLPALRKSFIWGYYGELQFVGLYGWEKETRYQNAFFDTMPIDWSAAGIIILFGIFIYFTGKYLFNRKEL